MNSALGRAIGVMLKQDIHRAVLGRIPRMPKEPRRPWRDTVFICDESQHFATVGENDPGGDEKFFSLSRQARLVALVATQSISSLRSALLGSSCVRDGRITNVPSYISAVAALASAGSAIRVLPEEVSVVSVVAAYRSGGPSFAISDTPAKCRFVAARCAWARTERAPLQHCGEK